MGFDLLSNPFAVLGLTPDAAAGVITARARNLSTPLAATAGRSLLVPRSRLQAELSYLPGASPELADDTVSALKGGRRPKLDTFVPLARANVLAHFASHRMASADDLRYLVRLQDEIRHTAGKLIGSARERAGMPQVPRDMLETALETLVDQQADAFTEGALALASGADLLAEQLCAPASGAAAQANFLRQSAVAWDRATASDAHRDLESAASIETALRHHPEPEAAKRLRTIVLRFAGRTKPPREARRLVGLPHEASENAAQKWRALALDLNNRQGAVLEAVILLAALVDGFGMAGELGGRIAGDLTICRERLESGDGTPEARRLVAAIDAGIEKELVFQRSALVNGRKTVGTPAVVVELYDAFVAAAQLARSDMPWRLLRAFTLRLHNEFSATEAALAFTQLAVEQGTSKAVASEIMRQLHVDLRTLQKERLSLALGQALYNKQNGVAQRLLTELINLTDDIKEKLALQASLRKVTAQQTTARIKYGFYGVLALGILYFAATSNNDQPTATGDGNYVSSANGYSQPTTSTPSSSTSPETVDAVAHQERRPASGTTPLTRPELRWCRYGQARAKAARDYLRAMRSSRELDTRRYNAGVDAYNAFLSPLRTACGHYRYWQADGLVIDAELNQNATLLRTEGQQLIADAYERAVTPIRPVVPSYGSSISNPVTAITPATAYGQGRAARKAWDTWFAGLSTSLRDGAGWWARVRSLRWPPACTGAPGPDHTLAVSGCRAARARLAGVDRRRLSDPSYRAGWNNP